MMVPLHWKEERARGTFSSGAKMLPFLLCCFVWGLFLGRGCLGFWFYSQPMPQIESECSSKQNFHLQVYNPDIFNLFAKLKKLDQWDGFPLRANESCPFPFLQNLLLFWFYFLCRLLFALFLNLLVSRFAKSEIKCLEINLMKSIQEW